MSSRVTLNRVGVHPAVESDSIGFGVSVVPEPATLYLSAPDGLASHLELQLTNLIFFVWFLHSNHFWCSMVLP